MIIDINHSIQNQASLIPDCWDSDPGFLTTTSTPTPGPDCSATPPAIPARITTTAAPTIVAGSTITRSSGTTTGRSSGEKIVKGWWIRKSFRRSLENFTVVSLFVCCMTVDENLLPGKQWLAGQVLLKSICNFLIFRFLRFSSCLSTLINGLLHTNWSFFGTSCVPISERLCVQVSEYCQFIHFPC